MTSVETGEPRSIGSGVRFESISVFFPAFNDAPSLPSLIQRTMEVLRRRVDDFEIIVVNDGSTDETGAVLHALEIEYAPYLRIVTHEQNRGYGGALRSGFGAATKEWVFYTDGDGQYNPSELELLLDSAEPGTGLVNGYKIARNDPWHRIAIGWLYNKFARTLFGIKLRDIDCDFRLIRRSLLDDGKLRSTSGTICIELVKTLEQSGAGVVEVPVSHHARQHGRSQFFRIRSLATTFLQLCWLWLRMVALPRGQGRNSLLMLGVVAFLSAITYARSVGIPPIADDYVQIELGRHYGPVSNWPALAADALYRCRATSLVLTWWTDRLFGTSTVVLGISSLLLHILNAFLVYRLGSWKRIGWTVSAVAAAFFAVVHHHQEAVIWYAALPELLVFTFSLSTILCWIRWLDDKRTGWYVASLGLFILALLSKESAVAVIPLIGAMTLWESRRHILYTAPFALLGMVYFFLAWQARSTHLHFNDGTFSLHAPFVQVLANSMGRLLWLWSGLALIAALFWRERNSWKLLAIAGVWIVVALLPYSFLMYMPRVPSRHTYLAGVGQSLIAAAGLLALRRRTAQKAPWAFAVVATVIVLHQASYIWTRKHEQFVMRAEPTEKLLSIVREAEEPVYIKCFPYDKSVAEFAIRQRGGATHQPVIFGGEATEKPGALDLCNAVTGRGHF